jgi:hypothetical protein
LQRYDLLEHRYRLLNILGYSFDLKYQELVEKFLYNPDDPMLAKLALQILCYRFAKEKEYVDYVLDFMKGVSWDKEDDCKLVAISIAGESLRMFQSKELLSMLISIFEQEESMVINQTAYLALMRALGFDRKEMPPSFRLLDPNTEIDKNII